MNDTSIKLPENYKSIQEASKRINFSMPSDLQTGSLLRTLVASKPQGRFLELGTGTGLSLSWITESMDNESIIISIDNSEEYTSVAREFFKTDPRVEILCADANEWLKNNPYQKFDLIFADAWPGKYSTLDEALNMVKTGGFYIIDDMLPQPNWPETHGENVERLVNYLETRQDLRFTKMNWSTGIIIVTKI
ncbi:O-methyltransferase [Pedobacter nutrimenti]|uniref:O-methyltransferase n=1 Tax=Pedobacter nutrimenti TaxID=1241337 RepID=UPI00292F2AE4|nr:class I SAM-dependent methyltransferase [Pedobacter nutrimenti]